MTEEYIARHAHYDAHGAVASYELLFRGKERFQDSVDHQLAATSRVLHALFTHLDAKRVLTRGQKGFVNIDESGIFSGIVGLIPPGEIVLEINAGVELSEKLIGHLRGLKSKGHLFSLDGFTAVAEEVEAFTPYLAIFNYLKFDMRNARPIPRRFMDRLEENGVLLIASKIETQEKYLACKKAGFHYFQGFYFQQPEIIRVKIPVESQKTAIMNVIRLIKNGEDSAQIERYVRLTPDFGHTLLKFLNSPAVALKERISSLEHAINLIGRDKLMRWLLVYLFSECAVEEGEPSLLALALKRAQQMEQRFKEDPKRAQTAYLTGMLSMLDALFDTPIRQIMEGLPVEKEIYAAVVRREGEMGRQLKEIELNERRILQALVEENYQNIDVGDLMGFLDRLGVPLDSLTNR